MHELVVDVEGEPRRPNLNDRVVEDSKNVGMVWDGMVYEEMVRHYTPSPTQYTRTCIV